MIAAGETSRRRLCGRFAGTLTALWWWRSPGSPSAGRPLAWRASGPEQGLVPRIWSGEPPGRSATVLLRGGAPGPWPPRSIQSVGGAWSGRAPPGSPSLPPPKKELQEGLTAGAPPRGRPAPSEGTEAWRGQGSGKAVAGPGLELGPAWLTAQPDSRPLVRWCAREKASAPFPFQTTVPARSPSLSRQEGSESESGGRGGQASPCANLPPKGPPRL